MKRGKRRLHTDRCLCRVKAYGQVIQNDIDDVIPDLSGVVRVVCKCLVIRDQNIDLVEFAGVLKFDAALQ